MNADDLPWNQLFQISSVPMSIVDAHGRQLAFNDAYADFLGYTPDEIVNLDVGRITRPEDQEWTRHYLMQLIAGEIDDFTTDKYFVRKDGSRVLGQLSTRAVFDDGGHCRCLIATIGPRPDSDEPMPDTLASRLLEFTSDAVTLVDRSGKIVASHGQRRRLAGYPTTYWRGRQLADLFPPGEFEHLLGQHAGAIAVPGAELTTEIELLAADGSPHLSAVRVVNATDDPILDGYVIVSRDVTAERAHLDDLTRQRATAESVVDAQTRLLATVSHELRNPLHAVRGIAELLVGEPLSPRAAELATSLLRQLSGLTHVTQDLLDAARLDAGKVTIEPVATDIRALIDDLVGLGRAALGGKRVAVGSRIAPGVPDWALVDADRLRQVLSNLVGNAVKFTEQGSVQLLARPGNERSVIFSVVDTGVGIPPEEQAAVLEPFTVATTAGDGRGAGLGLSIVRRLTSAMGGSISLTSAVGDGTRIDVTLPLVPCAPPSEAEVRELPSGLRVLVIEDNPVNQQLARSQLERLGLTAVVAGDGETGFAILTDPAVQPFDVILMDQQLPGWDGTETTRRIRDLGGEFAEIPVIGLSASSSPSDRAAFLEAGMNDLVAKPASLDDLSKAIAAQLDGHGGSAEPAPAGDGVAGASAAGDADGIATDDAGTVEIDVLATLADDLGSAEIVGELVATFLAELDARVAAIVDGDEQLAKRAAHTLKSSSRLLGAMGLADVCAEIERTGAPRDAVADLAHQTRTRLDDWLTGSRSSPEPDEPDRARRTTEGTT